MISTCDLLAYIILGTAILIIAFVLSKMSNILYRWLHAKNVGDCNPEYIPTPYYPEIKEYEQDSKEYQLITELLKIPAQKWAEGIQSVNGVDVELIPRYYPIKCHFLIDRLKIRDERVDELSSIVDEIKKEKWQNKQEASRQEKLDNVLIKIKNHIND